MTSRRVCRLLYYVDRCQLELEWCVDRGQLCACSPALELREIIFIFA